MHMKSYIHAHLHAVECLINIFLSFFIASIGSAGAHIHLFLFTYIHTYIQSHMLTDKHTYLYIHNYKYVSDIHSYIHTCMDRNS